MTFAARAKGIGQRLFGRGAAWLRTLRRPKRAALAVSFLALFAMFAFNTDWGGDPDTPRGDGKYRPVLARGDGHMMYLMSRSIVFDRDLVFDNDLGRFGDPWRQRVTETGRKDIPHPIGPPLVWAPILTSAHVLSKIANVFGADIPSHGYTMFHQRIVFFFSVLFAFGAVLLGRRVAERKLGLHWPATYAAIAVLFGTSVTYYATNMPSYGHAMDAFFCGLFLAVWALTLGGEGREQWRRFVLLGVLLGIASLIRVQNLALGIVVAIESVAIGVAALRPFRGAALVRIASRGALVLIVALIVFSPQLLAWKLLYGEFLYSPGGPNYVRLDHPLVFELLFSSRNGWLSSHPIAYAGVLGLGCVVWRSRLLGVGLFAALALQVWINASPFDWWAQASFGSRRMCSMTMVLVVGLAALIHEAARLIARVRRPHRIVRHGLAIVVLGWFVIWNYNEVQRIRGGKAAGYRTGPSCCKRAVKPMRSVAQPIYDAVGNPFSFPANALFSIRHGVPLTRWDVAVGNYIYVPGVYQYIDGSYRKHIATFALNTRAADRYITGGFGPAQNEKPLGAYRWTTKPKARVLIPILLPESHNFVLEVSARAPKQHLRITLNGDEIYSQTIRPGRQIIRFVAPDETIIVGSNELIFESALGTPPATGPTPPPATPAVGIAVGKLRIGFPRR